MIHSLSVIITHKSVTASKEVRHRRLLKLLCCDHHLTSPNLSKSCDGADGVLEVVVVFLIITQCNVRHSPHSTYTYLCTLVLFVVIVISHVMNSPLIFHFC